MASEGRSSTAGPAPLLGDALVVAGALLYAVSNVTQELFLGGAGTAEVLGMVGAFGALIAAAQAAILERGAWADLLAAGPSGGLAAAAGALAAFTAALFAFSSLVPVVLIWGGATALNLSLLTSDLWAAAARVALFGGFGGAAGWFAGALALVAAGLCLYASAGSPEGGGGGGLPFQACPTSDDACGSPHLGQQSRHGLGGHSQQQQQPQPPWSTPRAAAPGGLFGLDGGLLDAAAGGAGLHRGRFQELEDPEAGQDSSSECRLLLTRSS